MTENKGSTNGSENKNNTKDISEILKMLRDSVGKPVEEKPTEKLDDHIEEKLREKLDEVETVKLSENRSDEIDEPDTEESFDEELDNEELEDEEFEDEELEDEELEDEEFEDEELENEEFEDEEFEDEELEDEEPLDAEAFSEEEIDEILDRAEADPDEDDAPWYGEESDENSATEDDIKEDVNEDDAPWYGEESDENSAAEYDIKEETNEDDAPWYGEESDENDAAEDDIKEDTNEDDAPWYGEDGDDFDGISDDTDTDVDEPWYSDDEEGDEFSTEDELSDEELTEEDIIDADETAEESSNWYIDDEETADEEEFIDDETEEEFIDDESEEEFIDDEPEEEFIDDEVEEEFIDDEPEEEFIDDEVEEEFIDDEVEDEGNEDESSVGETDSENVDESSFDEVDISLLEAMGYNTVVDDNGDDEIVRKTSENEENIAYGHDGVEYVTDDQSDDIIAGYKSEKKRIGLRLAVTGGLSLLLMIYEVLFFSGVTMPWIFNQRENPLAHIMISLQLLVIVFAVSAKPLCIGLRDLFIGKASPYSVSAAVITANLIYTIVTAFILPENFMLFNFVGALSVLLAVAYEYLLLCHEFKTFRVISDKRVGARFALEDDDCSGEVLGAPVRSLRAYRTKFNKDYFARTGKLPVDMKGLGIITAAVFGAALVSFIMAAIFGAIGDALKVGILIINFAMPLATLCTYSLPIMLASHKFMKNKGAIIGHSAADEYAEVGFLTFDEEDLFPSMKVSNVDFKPSGDLPVAEILRKTALMFSQIGGPIKRMVRVDAAEYEDGEVEIRGIFDDGISALVDGVDMLAGSARFLELYGVDFSASSDARDQDPCNGILYVAIGGRLAARYYIKYRPDRDFVRMVNMLGELGVAVGVRSHNPAVNSDVIAARCPAMRYKIYAIKSGSGERDDITSERDETESGICANQKAAFLATPFVTAKRLKKIYRTDRLLRVISASVGAVFVIIMAALGLVHEFNSVQAALYQIAWMLPSATAAVLAFCQPKK